MDGHATNTTLTGLAGIGSFLALVLRLLHLTARQDGNMVTALSLFMVVYADIQPIIADLGGADAVWKDGMAIFHAVHVAHQGVVAARAPTSDGGARVTVAEGEPLAIAFCGTLAMTIATNAGVTDTATTFVFAKKLGGALIPKVFAHITGQQWDVIEAAAKAAVLASQNKGSGVNAG